MGQTQALPAVGGYDVTEYFSSGKAVRGSGFNVSEYEGQTYLFASEDNKKQFDDAPDSFLPQFGGWCAYGCSVGKKFHVNPEVFAVVDGKLYLNLDDGISGKFNEDLAANIEKAHANWSDIEAKDPGEL